MRIEHDGGGKVVFAAPAWRWSHQDGAAAAMQTCRVAGQEMMVITDDAGAFDLHFMHFMTRGFTSMEAAKTAAPELAKTVLSHLLTTI